MEQGFGVSPPVDEGENYVVAIEDIGKEGDGVAKVENFVVFVPETEVGDKVKIEVTKVLRTMAFGEVVERMGTAEETEEEEEETEEAEKDEEVEEIEEIELA